MTPDLDTPLFEHTDDALARPLPAGLVAARADVLAAAMTILTIPADRLAQPWAWIDGGEDEVRYGAYRAAEALELARVDASQAAHAAARDAHETMAARFVGAATEARWDVHGLMLPLGPLLDADPGGGEWSMRLVMGHIIGGQRAYAWGTGWWLGVAHPADAPDLPAGAPESFWAAIPDEATTEAEGDLETLRARLDAVLDTTTERLSGLPDDRLGLGARWSGFPVTIAFRYGRWGSHMREHTIQIEKTLALLGHVPDEPARLVRHVLAAYGRAEAVVYGRVEVDDAVERIAAAARETRAAARAAAAAARQQG